MNSVIRSPSTLFLEVTSECNSRCKYCHMWSLSDDEQVLSTKKKISLIKEFAAINPNGEVVLTGGEPLLKPDEFFELIAACRGSGLTSSVNTNGSLIDEEVQKMVVREGPSYIVFSLDSDQAEIHDYHRGVAGGFFHTVDILTSLMQLRKSSVECRTEILINTVVTDLNIDSLIELLLFAAKLEVDGVTLQMLSPTFHRIGRYDKFFENHFFPDKPAAIQRLQVLIEKLADFPILRTTERDLFWMQKYIINPHSTSQPVCNSHERNLVVDHKGNVQLCFNMSKILSGDVLGNVCSDSLEKMWTGRSAGIARKVMESCRLSCGMLNCHRKAGY